MVSLLWANLDGLASLLAPYFSDDYSSGSSSGAGASSLLTAALPLEPALTERNLTVGATGLVVAVDEPCFWSFVEGIDESFIWFLINKSFIAALVLPIIVRAGVLMGARTLKD